MGTRAALGQLVYARKDHVSESLGAGGAKGRDSSSGPGKLSQTLGWRREVVLTWRTMGREMMGPSSCPGEARPLAPLPASLKLALATHTLTLHSFPSATEPQVARKVPSLCVQGITTQRHWENPDKSETAGGGPAFHGPIPYTLRGAVWAPSPQREW